MLAAIARAHVMQSAAPRSSRVSSGNIFERWQKARAEVMYRWHAKQRQKVKQDLHTTRWEAAARPGPPPQGGKHPLCSAVIRAEESVECDMWCCWRSENQQKRVLHHSHTRSIEPGRLEKAVVTVRIAHQQRSGVDVVSSKSLAERLGLLLSHEGSANTRERQCL